jgi:hypothetical protein
MASGQPGASSRRLSVLTRHLAAADAPGHAAVSASSCSSAVKSLPRFDAYLMETYLDDLRDLKRQVYDTFKFNPDALTPVEEGLSKGGQLRIG